MRVVSHQEEETGVGNGKSAAVAVITTTVLPQPFYGPISGTTRVSQRQKKTSGLFGARED